MTTRIREVRHLRGLTLQRLADLVGTTAQTIQRLETNSMTISIDWLERIGKALEMNPASLLTSYATPLVPLVGELTGDGTIKRTLSETAHSIEIKVPVEDPIAVSLRTRFGPHEAGTILIANRVKSKKKRTADGRDCVVELGDGSLIFRRIVHGRGGTTAYVPYEDGSNVERNLNIVWIAPVVMSVRYLPLS